MIFVRTEDQVGGLLPGRSDHAGSEIEVGFDSWRRGTVDEAAGWRGDGAEGGRRSRTIVVVGWRMSEEVGTSGEGSGEEGGGCC